MYPLGSQAALAPGNRTRYLPSAGSSSAIRASLRPVLVLTIVNRTFPSGSAAGHQCPISCLFRSASVRGGGAPPSAETDDRPDRKARENTIRPSAVQVDPAPPWTSHTAMASPPAAAILKILPLRTNPIHAPSGDRNGPRAPS